MSVSVLFLRAVSAAVAQLGCAEPRLLRAAGLRGDVLSDVSAHLCDRDAMALFEAAVRLSNEPALGLRVAELCSESSLHLLGHLWMASTTLREALSNFAELGESLVAEPAPRWVDDAKGARLELPAAGSREGARFFAEVMLGLVCKLVQRAAPGTRSTVTAVHFAYPRPRYAGLYGGRFGAEVSFERATNAVFVADATLDVRLPGRDPGVASALKRLIHEQLIAPHKERSWTSRVRRALREESDLAHVDFDELAFRWGLTHRTLRRRVQSEGHSLADLLDGVRFERASAQLERPEESIKEVAERLGYAETSSFHRAFKRWAGVTPSEYRKRSHGALALEG
jgi:AraC-like DNA-binding protein